MKNTLLLFLLATLTSCSFNTVFLQPTPIPRQAKKATMINPATHDTTVVRFAGDNFQPTFTNKKNDVLDQGFLIESVLFKNANGTQLNGWLLTPKMGNSAITLLHLHGNGGNILSQADAIYPLVKKGFQVFVFDYSGFGFSEGKATQQNILVDALSAVDYVKTRKEVAQTKLIIYGQSVGGHLAAVVAEKKESVIDGLVIEGAFSSPKDIAAYRVKHAIGLGFIGRLLLKSSYSAVESIRNYHKPLLVIHSTEDKEIPFFMGKKLYDTANNPKQFYQIGGEHIYGPILYADSIASKIMTMVK